jgi:hypothetical protein
MEDGGWEWFVKVSGGSKAESEIRNAEKISPISVVRNVSREDAEGPSPSTLEAGRLQPGVLPLGC